jgi:hypothetical protein
MKVLRILLLIFMAFVVLLMAGCPGLYDSKRRFSSHRQFYDAQRQHETAPTAETQRALDGARKQLEDAKRLDRRDIMFFEAFMLGILGVSIYAFIRAGKSVQKNSAA